MFPPEAAAQVLRVHGGGPLEGVIRLSGAKNSVLKLMAASLLADEPVTLSAVPDITDVPVMLAVLEGLGVRVDRDLAGGTAQLEVVDDREVRPPRDAVTRIRASVSCLGPLVARRGAAELALPGGDRIGARSIDLHLAGLEAMGATVERGDGSVVVHAEQLQGARITLDFPSVGATENLVMAATLARGRTVIDNAAREPEIADLCRMLVAMGADIRGIGSPTVVIEGVERLGGATWETCPDRIEAGTYLVAAALTGGRVRVERVRADDLTLPLRKLTDAGATVEVDGDAITVERAGARLEPVDVVTLPYPGFPTDLQPQMMVLLTQADGLSRCTENVFESRFSFVDQLSRMGADIDVDGHHAMLSGPTRLRGATLEGLDVRAAAAGVLAGLVAEGETFVRDVHHIDRGYADFVGRLRSLGADVTRVVGERAVGGDGD